MKHATIKYQDVTLRPMTKEDQKLVLEWRSNPELSRLMYTDMKDASLSEQQAWFDAVLKRKDCRYWMITCDGVDLGVVNLTLLSPEHQRTDWAFYLGSAEARGKGIGSKVETAMIHYAFSTLGLKKLHCQVFSGNSAVIKLHQKFGFEVEGILKKHFLRHGEWQDLYLMSLFDEVARSRDYAKETVTVTEA